MEITATASSRTKGNSGMSAATSLRPVDVRKETDGLDEVVVPSAALWGAQTQRSLGRSHVEKLGVIRLGVGLILVMTFVAIMALPLSVSAQNFSVPDDVALRIRLDDTLTSIDSQVGDPFSATVVDKGDYQNARVYGHVAQIDMSGRVKGHTSMMLRFDRLVMPDGRRARIHAEIVQLYHAPSGEKVDVEGAIESGGRGRKSIEHTAIGAGAGALLGGIFGGGKGAGIGSIIGGAGGLGTTAFHGRQKITLGSGQEMLIRITGR
jgi:hypothetical protein